SPARPVPRQRLVTLDARRFHAAAQDRSVPPSDGHDAERVRTTSRARSTIRLRFATRKDAARPYGNTRGTFHERISGETSCKLKTFALSGFAATHARGFATHCWLWPPGSRRSFATMRRTGPASPSPARGTGSS